MLIRSQNKKVIINLDNIESISINGYRVSDNSIYEDEENANKWYITCSISQDYAPFAGNYSTEAKAIKVLGTKCDYWEREAKKYCSQLGEIRIKVGRKLNQYLTD